MLSFIMYSIISVQYITPINIPLEYPCQKHSSPNLKFLLQIVCYLGYSMTAPYLLLKEAVKKVTKVGNILNFLNTKNEFTKIETLFKCSDRIIRANPFSFSLKFNFASLTVSRTSLYNIWLATVPTVSVSVLWAHGI